MEIEKQKLIIVESPAKAKTIQKYLGKNYIVRASFGHIRDLNTKELGIDVENGFRANYIIKPDQKKRVNDLKQIIRTVDEVILATDEDREGEAIAWHLREVLQLPANTPRMVFHEITPTALQNSIKNLRTVDMNLVNSQQTRRIIDRLVGYKISPLLWKAIEGGLSAGRVQSVALKLVKDRERDISQFAMESAYEIRGNFALISSQELQVNGAKYYRTNHTKISKELIDDILSTNILCLFIISKIENTQTEKSPSPPFITSSLQQDAYNRLHLTAKQTMSIAQKLYEAGHITYHRTDSFVIAKPVQNQILQYIRENYGEQYARARIFTNKSKSAQEAHECIRPTKIEFATISGFNTTETRLYELIWQRTMASQMANAIYSIQRIYLKTPDMQEEYFLKTNSRLEFPGFMRIYKMNLPHLKKDNGNNNASDGDDNDPESLDEESTIMENIEEGMEFHCNELAAEQKFTNPESRYTEATLVKKLEKMEIGRPSTYANIISTILDRGYIEKKNMKGAKIAKEDHIIRRINPDTIEVKMGKHQMPNETNKFHTTEIGDQVSQFLETYCSEIIHYDFTREMEKQLDDITNGSIRSENILENFYPLLVSIQQRYKVNKSVTPDMNIHFKEPIESVQYFEKQTSEDEEEQISPDHNQENEDDPQQTTKSKSYSASAASAASAANDPRRYLGLDPVTNKPVYVYRARYGPVIQIGEKPEIRFIKLPQDISIKKCTLTDLVQLMKYPKLVCTWEEKPVMIQKGPYGFYIKWNNKNYKIPPSLHKNIDQLTETQIIPIITTNNTNNTSNTSNTGKVSKTPAKNNDSSGEEDTPIQISKSLFIESDPEDDQPTVISPVIAATPVKKKYTKKSLSSGMSVTASAAAVPVVSIQAGNNDLLREFTMSGDIQVRVLNGKYGIYIQKKMKDSTIQNIPFKKYTDTTTKDEIIKAMATYKPPAANSYRQYSGKK
jgi:DNA topoisomerase-1